MKEIFALDLLPVPFLIILLQCEMLYKIIGAQFFS